MATQRKIVFANDKYYHVFNRGIDRRVTFLSKYDFQRAKALLAFYQYAVLPVRYSRYCDIPTELQQQYFEIMKRSGVIVNIVAYCLMPNHFHLLLKQKSEKGIATFVGNFVNAYTKYFNTKHDRSGSLYQGVFKTVYVETDEQLVHLTRYIHLNPAASNVIIPEELHRYQWSSYPSYIRARDDGIVTTNTVEAIKTVVPEYESFVMDQIAYAKVLEKIKQMTFA